MKELEAVKERILSVISDNNGNLTETEFDKFFSSFTIENGKRVRGKFLAFPPIWFICANTDKSRAFHLQAIHELVLAGKLNHNNSIYSLAEDIGAHNKPVNIEGLLNIKPNLVKTFL